MKASWAISHVNTEFIITCFRDYLYLCYQGFMWLVTEPHCTWSPFVPRLPWLDVVGETSYGIKVGFIKSKHILHYLFLCLFICIWGVKSTLMLRKQKSYSHNRKENSHSFPPEIISLFLLTTVYTTSLIPLGYLAASISHPILLSAAKPFSV